MSQLLEDDRSGDLIQRKVRCLDRLMKLSNCFSEFAAVLVEDKVLTQQEILTVYDAKFGQYYYELLERAVKAEKLDVLDYEWQVLPFERIRLTIVTPRRHKEFIYSEF